MSFNEIIAHLDASTARHVGTVRFFNVAKGFGFIKRDGAGDIFVHARDLQQSGITSLLPDQRVEFEIHDGRRGPVAGDIKILEQESLAGEN